jgi:hypothetical protein
MTSAPRVDDRIRLPDGRWLAYTEFGDPNGRPVLFFLFHGTPGLPGQPVGHRRGAPVDRCPAGRTGPSGRGPLQPVAAAPAAGLA